MKTAYVKEKLVDLSLILVTVLLLVSVLSVFSGVSAAASSANPLSGIPGAVGENSTTTTIPDNTTTTPPDNTTTTTTIPDNTTTTSTTTTTIPDNTTTTTTPPDNTTTTTTIPGLDTSKFNFENGKQGWRSEGTKIIALVQTTSEHRYGSGSLQCTIAGVGAGSGSGSEFGLLRARPDNIGYSYNLDLRGKTLSVWVKFPSSVRENEDQNDSHATIQAKMFLFWGDGWNWLDSGSVYYLQCDGDWEQLTWNLSGVTDADLTKVHEVGLQFGEWGLSHPWNGTFWIDAYDWASTTTSTTTTTTTPGQDTSKYGFETGAQGWQCRSNITSVAQCTTDSKYGYGSLQCTYSNSAGYLDGSVYVRPSSLVDISNATLSLWVKFPLSATGVQAKMCLMDSSWTWYDQGTAVTIITGGMWQQITWDLSGVPSSARSSVAELGLMVANWGGTSWSGTFWIDAYDWVGTTTTTTTSTTTTTPPSGSDNSKFNFETGNMGWIGEAHLTALAQTTTEHKYGFGSLQCMVTNSGVGGSSNSEFRVRGRVDAIGPYTVDLTGKTVSVWVKFPENARENPNPGAAIQAKMYLFWTNDFGVWNWLDSGSVYSLQCDNDWEQLTWNLSPITGVNLTKVVAVGIQFGEWGLSYPWNGTFWIDAYDWAGTISKAATSLVITPSTFTLQSGSSATLTATLMSNGAPLAGKTLTWNATSGGIVPSSGVTNSLGQVSVTYAAPSHEDNVVVTVTFAGDSEYYSSSYSSSGLVEAALLQAIVELKPDSLRIGYGDNWMTCYIELPEISGVNVSQIDVSTILLEGIIPVDISAHTEIGDYDNDGAPDLMVKFDISSVENIVSPGPTTLTVTGRAGGLPFIGSDTIDVISYTPGGLVSVVVGVSGTEPTVRHDVFSFNLGLSAEVDNGVLRVTVSSENSEGQTIVVDIFDNVIKFESLDEITVLFDNQKINVADSYEDVLDPTNENVAEYVVILGRNGVQLLISVPHFSAHVIDIGRAVDFVTPSQPSATSSQPPAEGTPLAVILAVAGVVLIAAISVAWVGLRRDRGEATSELIEHGLSSMRIQEIEIFREIKGQKKFTIPDLINKTDASTIIAWRTVQKLIANGLVKPTGDVRPPAARRGKPSTVYRYVGDS